jgi:hypothetical protein
MLYLKLCTEMMTESYFSFFCIKEPPPQNRSNYDMEEPYETPRGRMRERGRPEASPRPEKAEHMRTPYDDLVADGQPTDDLKLAFCNKCFKSNAV